MKEVIKDLKQLSTTPVIQTGVFIFTLFCFFFWTSFSELLKSWIFSDNYSHGILLFGIYAYLIYSHRYTIQSVIIKPDFRVLIPLLITIALWLISNIASIRTIELSLVPFIFFLALSASIGLPTTKKLLPAFSLSLIAIPIWDLLIPLLQTLAVYVTEHALSLSGIPTYIEGTNVSIPEGQFTIAGGCSGLRYLVVTLTLGALYSHLYIKKRRHVFYVMLYSVVFPVIANWIRIYLIILIGHLSKMESSLVNDHDGFGWVLYAVSLLPYYLIIKNFPLKEPDEEALPHTPQHNAIMHPVLVATIIIFSLPLIYNSWRNHQEQNILIPTINIPGASSPWTGPLSYQAWKPGYHGASLELHKEYIATNSLNNVALHVFLYLNQKQGHELINSLNQISKKYISISTIVSSEGDEIEQHIFMDKNKTKKITWSWFRVNDDRTTSEHNAKLFQIKETFKGQVTSGLVVLSSNCLLDCEKEKQLMQLFYSAHREQLSRIY